jgi:hypothetical protein
VKRRPVSFSTVRPLPPIDPFIQKVALLGSDSGCLELMTSERGPTARATLRMAILALIITSACGILPTVRRKLTGKCYKNHFQEIFQPYVPLQHLFCNIYLPAPLAFGPRMAMQIIGQLVANFSTRTPSFNPRAVNVGLLLH